MIVHRSEHHLSFCLSMLTMMINLMVMIVRNLVLLRIISQAAKLGTQGTQAQRVFSLEELKEATNNFSQLLILGEGYIRKVSLN